MQPNIRQERRIEDPFNRLARSGYIMSGLTAAVFVPAGLAYGCINGTPFEGTLAGLGLATLFGTAATIAIAAHGALRERACMTDWTRSLEPVSKPQEPLLLFPLRPIAAGVADRAASTRTRILS